LQFVVIEIAAEPSRRQHHDFPVVHAAPTTLAAGVAVHVFADERQHFTPQFGIAIDMLQGPKNGNDLITALQIQHHLADGQAIQSFLRARQTHGFPP